MVHVYTLASDNIITSLSPNSINSLFLDYLFTGLPVLNFANEFGGVTVNYVLMRMHGSLCVDMKGAK